VRPGMCSHAATRTQHASCMSQQLSASNAPCSPTRRHPESKADTGNYSTAADMLDDLGKHQAWCASYEPAFQPSRVVSYVSCTNTCTRQPLNYILFTPAYGSLERATAFRWSGRYPVLSASVTRTCWAKHVASPWWLAARRAPLGSGGYRWAQRRTKPPTPSTGSRPVSAWPPRLTSQPRRRPSSEVSCTIACTRHIQRPLPRSEEASDLRIW
jgi:hypothetical protein